MAKPKSARRGSILFVVRGGENVPSCRFRAYQFREPLRRLGVEASYVVLEKSRNPWRQLLFHLRLIPVLRRHDAVIFQKLLEPWRLTFLKAFNANLYWDFDDAMYAAADGAKFPATVKAAPHVLAGNEILADKARAFNPDVAVIPTTVPIPLLVNGDERKDGPLIVSWIGTAANLPYLEPALKAMETQGQAGALTLRILTEKPEQAPQRPWIRVLPWSREAEEKEFRGCDLGLMPMPDTAWCAGKCACKALQYLSYGKPVIASPVGVNRDLFAQKPFAKLAQGAGEWESALQAFADDPELRRQAGRRGFEFVRAGFDVELWAQKLAAHVLDGR